MKATLMVLIAICLSGCEAWSQRDAQVTQVTHICVDWVAYLHFTTGTSMPSSAASVAYSPDGKIRTCK